jgi:hypothetical protein
MHSSVPNIALNKKLFKKRIKQHFEKHFKKLIADSVMERVDFNLVFESLLKKADTRSDQEIKLLVLLLQNMQMF